MVETKTRIKTAYTLLPPPLSALPAKYWTTISLFAHSYSVGVVFERLTEYVSELKPSLELPLDKDAFILGFIHDMGQKLVKTPDAKPLVENWVKEKLESLGYTPYEASHIAKTVSTNPAETLSSPLFTREAWKLLRLADHVHGTSSIVEYLSDIERTFKELGVPFTVNYYNVSLPHPFIRASIAEKLIETINREIDTKILIATHQGLIVITPNPLGKIEISWNELRYLPENEVNKIIKKHEEKCVNKPSGKKKSSSKYCKKIGKYRIDEYELVLLYYAPKHIVDKQCLNWEPVLPSTFKKHFINLVLSDVIYSNSGRYTCPICGVRTEYGVYISTYTSIIEGKLFSKSSLAKEKWSRRYPPGNLNIMLGESTKYRVCPICGLDALLESRIIHKEGGKMKTHINMYYSITFQTLMPLDTLLDLAGILDSLVRDVQFPASDKDIVNILNPARLIEKIGKVENYSYLIDPFSATIYAKTSVYGEGFEETVRALLIAGKLSAYGLYPITISETLSTTPPERLISYKKMYPMYDVAPNDKKIGHLIPYISTLLISVSLLYRRKYYGNKSYPAVETVYNYSPELAPLLLQYSSPRAYSYISGILSLKTSKAPRRG